MHTEALTYEADGLRMVSHLYYDEGMHGPRPGVLVFPEAFGLGDHAKSRAERLADLGYVALACDLHGEGRVLSALNETMALIEPPRADPFRTALLDRLLLALQRLLHAFGEGVTGPTRRPCKTAETRV